MISFVGATANDTTTTTLTGSIPAGVQAGDVLVWTVVTHNANVTTPPAGWDLRNTLSPGPSIQVTYTRTVTASTPAPVLVMSAAGGHYGHLIAFRGVDTANPVDAVASVYNSANSTSHTAPTVTTTVADTMVLRVASCFTNTTRSYSWTGVDNFNWGASGTGRRYMASATQVKPVAGPTATSSATFTLSTWSYGLTLALRPRRKFRLGAAPKKLMLGAVEVQIRA